MGDFSFPCKYKKLIRALRKLGFLVEHASRHDLAKCVHNGHKTTIPRHNEVKREIVQSIADFLLEKDIPHQKLLKLLH